MTTNKPNKRVANPLIKKVLMETSPLKRKQIENRMDIACRISDLIKSKGLSASDFSRKLNRQPSEISKWLSGTHNLTIDTLGEIAFHLEVSIRALMPQDKSKTFTVNKTETITKTGYSSVAINSNDKAFPTLSHLFISSGIGQLVVGNC